MRILRVVMVAAVLVLPACSGDDDNPEAEQDATSTTKAAAAASTLPAGTIELKTSPSPAGAIVVDGEARTVYLFTNDPPNASSCTGACEQTWPPVFAENVNVGFGVDAALIGTTTSREGGRSQAVYNGHALYRYSGDTKAGEVNGRGVNGVWFPVSPAGEPVK